MDKQWYSSCIIEAVKQKILRPRLVRIKITRNATNRIHFYWVENGLKYEFYAKGRSKLPYWKNLLYKGCIKRIK